MTSTLVPTLRAESTTGRSLARRSPRPDPRQRQLTALVVDESDATDVESLVSMIGDTDGTVTIFVTRHPVPPCVLGLGTGTEATLMWTACRTEWRTNVDATADRVRALRRELRPRGQTEVEIIDSFPTWRPFRSLQRREIDGLVRRLERLDPERIVIDPAHHLASEIGGALEKRRPTDQR